MSINRVLVGASVIVYLRGCSLLYFTPSQSRVNYTGEWVNGEREGNGTTNFRDGAVYRGEYRCRVPRDS